MSTDAKFDLDLQEHHARHEVEFAWNSNFASVVAPLRFTSEAIEEYGMLGMSGFIYRLIDHGVKLGWRLHSWNLVHEGDRTYTAMVTWLRPETP